MWFFDIENVVQTFHLKTRTMKVWSLSLDDYLDGPNVGKVVDTDNLDDCVFVDMALNYK